MPMPLKTRVLATVMIPVFVLLVNGCAGPARIQLAFPPAADVERLQAANPEPTPDIVTDPAADARFNAAIENELTGKSDAGARLCQWFKDRGAAYPFPCGETSAERAARVAAGQ